MNRSTANLVARLEAEAGLCAPLLAALLDEAAKVITEQAIDLDALRQQGSDHG